MITRPLDLAARLRPEPRSFEWLFFVNGGLLVLFFAMFGSRFVLAPALGVDFRVPRMAGANAEATSATHFINVTISGQILVQPDGNLPLEQLGDWLRVQAKTAKEPVLLIIADEGVTVSMLSRIAGAAQSAGFDKVKYANEEPNAGRPKGR